MAAEKTHPPFLRQLLATLLLSCLLLALAPVRAFEFDCENEARETVAVLSFCKGDSIVWRRTCLYGGGYSTDGSGQCTLVQSGALYCQDCQGNVNRLERCCDIDLSDYEYYVGQQANTYNIEWGISVLQCPGNSGCAASGYPQCNEGGYQGISPYWTNEYAYVQGYGYCPESSGNMLRALEPRAHSSGGVQLRELERPPKESAAPPEEIRAEPPIASSGDGAQARGVTKMRRRMWGSGRPMYSRSLWGSGRPWSPPKMYSRRLYGNGRQWYP